MSCHAISGLVITTADHSAAARQPTVACIQTMSGIQTIPPTAVQQDPGETSTVRRWSAKALATARVEPCRTGGDCPVTAKPVKFANQAAA